MTRSIVEIGLSAGPLALIWLAAWAAIAAGWLWLALALTIPAAAFLVRLFMVQHDCGHRAFFRSAAANDWLGRTIGVLTLTPYDCWRRTHAIHHASSGDLDRRGLGAVPMLTVEEYRRLSPLGRVGYRLYRHPLILFGLGPFYVFFLKHRLPIGQMRDGWRPWASALGTNLVIGLCVAAAIWLGGWRGLVLVYVPTMIMAAAIGVWLFYVQHQFEHVHWARSAQWDITESALRGSSHYDLPPVLRWITANIGVHHVHHLRSRIPFYRLQRVLGDYPQLRAVSRIGLRDSLRCVWLALWDEDRQRLVSFRELRGQPSAQPT